MKFTIWSILLLFTLKFILSQQVVYGQYINNESYAKVDTVTLHLAFECCGCGKKKNTIGNQFSFCRDGIEQNFGNPIFVTLNFGNFLDSYNQPVYLINNYECLPKLDIPDKYDELLRIENLINYKNIVFFYDGKFKKAINKRARKVHKSYANFDGKFYYGLFKMKIVRTPIGNVNKTLPELSLSKRNVYIFDRDVFAYCIIDILDIEPITKEEYLSNY